MIFRDLEIAVDPDEVTRRLGYRRGAEPRAHLAPRIERLWQQGLELLHPRGGFVIVQADRAESLGVPGAEDEVALAACTIGVELEDEARLRGQQGGALDSLVLDALGSAAAEATADALNRAICSHAFANGRFGKPRISPGYGSWNVGRQSDLLSTLPTHELGISLTDRGMMVPQKSVSFAVRFDSISREPEVAWRVCARCGLLDCDHRRTRNKETHHA